jgi:hypothetical protein
MVCPWIIVVRESIPVQGKIVALRGLKGGKKMAMKGGCPYNQSLDLPREKSGFLWVN